ncbi:hypothetical protein [Candidatus Enterococcus lemimoniae]|uniref:Uncharacterized protein n=1 Tax=Candidatus Enterococcus lemimoniae TaxID=1834167 RepID=A0ABZ2T3S5_9ENTE|nr:hypothetical protein [Enterococcus sp. 12C11_DIV0727]OTO68740.1 hypothetical protein A5866_000938 [Enterococcus sp. 12C11_DIV0727]
MTKIFIEEKAIEQYKKVVGYIGTDWPKAYLLVFWQAFSTPELHDKEYLLVRQNIQIDKKLTVNQEYECALQRTEIKQKPYGECWTYTLLFFYEKQVMAICESDLYVR